MTTAPTDDSPAAGASTGPPETPAAPASGEAPPAAAAANASSAVSPGGESTAAPDEALPEWEPLSPELVEEEAYHGDFMLRWAVILMALLYGWTHLADSRLLVQVRSGDYIRAHGWLPPATDVFSNSAAGRPWINLGWLGDAGLSLVHGLGGPSALTIAGALVAALVFWVAGRTALTRGGPTWGSSILAAAAVVACFPMLTPGSSLFTLLGAAALLALTDAARPTRASRTAAIAAVLFCVWSNSDPFAWFGLLLLWMMAAGRALSRVPQATAPSGGEGSPPTARAPAALWPAAVAGTVGALVNPFHWRVLESPVALHSRVFPEVRQYGAVGQYFPWRWYAAWESNFPLVGDVFSLTAMGLTVVSLLLLLLNLRRTRLELWLAWLAANAAACTFGELWPAAALVNAILGGWTLQEWVLRNGPVQYSIDWRALLFTRGGRAITVLAMFAQAYMFINGLLTGPDGRRLGLGFDWRLTSLISSFGKLAEGSPDDRPFNSRIEQGDVLIWVGQKPFIDTRIRPYVDGEDNILELHRNAYRALQPPQEGVSGSNRPDVWKPVFDRFRVNRVLTRLTGDDVGTKYRLLLGLLMNRELQMTRLEAAAAEFTRTDASLGAPSSATEGARKGSATEGSAVEGAREPLLQEYLATHTAGDFVKRAFRSGDAPVPSQPAGWPRELTSYDKWLMQPEPTLPESVQLAQHFEILSIEMPPRMPPEFGPVATATALRVLAIRSAREGLMTDPDNLAAYRLLARMYRDLGAQESQIAGDFGVDFENDLRTSQRFAALYGALKVSPQKAPDHEGLVLALGEQNLRDLGATHLKAIQDSLGRWTTLPPSDPNYEAVRDRNRTAYQDLRESIDAARERVDAELDKGVPVLQAAQLAMSAGCHEMALQILTDAQAEIVQDAQGELTYARLLMAVGRTEEAWERLEAMERMLPTDPRQLAQTQGLVGEWRMSAALARLAQSDYTGALKLLERDAIELTQSRLRGLLDSGPLAAGVGLKLDLFAAAHTRVAFEALYGHPERWSMLELLCALVDLERGQNAAATARLKGLIEHAPDAAIRPIVAYYLRLLTGEPYDFVGPEQQIPIWGGMFAPDPDPAPAESPAAAPAATTPAAEAAPDESPAATPAATTPAAEAAPTESPATEAPNGSTPVSEAPPESAPATEAPPPAEPPATPPGDGAAAPSPPGSAPAPAGAP